MDPLSAIKAKQAAGAVLTPLEYAQLNGQQQVGTMLQGQGAPSFATSLNGGDSNATPQSSEDSFNKAFSNLQSYNAPTAVTAPAASTGTGAGTASNASKYLPIQYIDGKPYDTSTSAGQLSFFHDMQAKNSGLNDIQLSKYLAKFNSNIASSADQYAGTKAGYDAAERNISGQANQYANNYAANGANLENSHGTNLAQIGATYAAASPGVFQSSQGQDTQFANANYEKGKQFLVNDRNNQVGNNYIQGTNSDGSLKLGQLGGTMGDSYNAQLDQSAQAGRAYDRYVTDQNSGLAEEKQQEAVGLNSQSDQTANNQARLNAYAGITTPNFGTSGYQKTALPTVDLSQYTKSPLSAESAGQLPGGNYNNYAIPAAVQNQTNQSQYLGYAPGTQQNGNLNTFLKAVNTPGY